MSAATDFLTHWMEVGAQHPPSITVVTCQPPGNQTPGSANWSPGIASYGWGINGMIRREGGSPVGLHFGELHVTFSDRIAGSTAQFPWDYQRFNPKARDRMELELALAGDSVKATAILTTWGNASWSVYTTITDADGGQLVFLSVPPAGPVPFSAVMVVALQPTGKFGWL